MVLKFFKGSLSFPAVFWILMLILGGILDPDWQQVLKVILATKFLFLFLFLERTGLRWWLHQAAQRFSRFGPEAVHRQGIGTG